MDLTIFELHLPEAQFNAPFANRGSGDVTDDERVAIEPPDPDEGAGGSSIRPVVALLVLVGLAALGWYLRRPDDDDAGIEAASDLE